MPLLLTKPISPYSTYAIWKISETRQQLLEKIKEPIPDKQGNQILEWMVTRILIRYLCNFQGVDYHGMYNLESGKPVLNQSQAEISLSHAFPMAAAIINLRKPCGIDLELPRQQLSRVKKKFLHQEELNGYQDLPHLCKMWTAKEVLIKLNGEKFTSMREKLRVSFDGEDRIKGKILGDGAGPEKSHIIALEKIWDYYLAYNI
jgi:phosphopantetheinyl transferase